MPEVAIQTEATLDATERQFKQEVLDYIEGLGNEPSSDVLKWLGKNLSPPKEQIRDPEVFTASVMEQIRQERSAHLKRLREGWEERIGRRPWILFY
ncbi:hypothetical protein C8R43DRAFT_1116416 [Mycena crocata]|nr:hypothetical protein C8R43DRAFT_1116416 [Mycena crocata]